MNHRPLLSQTMVFTLEEDAPITNVAHTTSVDENSMGWEQRLEQLRQTKQQQSSITALPIDPILTAVPEAVTGARTVIGRGIKTTEETVSQKDEAAPLLDSAQREQAYRVYLKQWQQQTNLAAAQQQADLDDTAVLLQEDWLAAQTCLQYASSDAPASQVVRLQENADDKALPVQADLLNSQDTNTPAAESTDIAPTCITHTPPMDVHLHVIEPQGAHGRYVVCWSEAELLARLDEKLRPHLADAMAGMVRVAIQKHTAQLVSQLQHQLLAEIPATVEEVLQHNLANIMQQLKQEQLP